MDSELSSTIYEEDITMPQAMQETDFENSTAFDITSVAERVLDEIPAYVMVCDSVSKNILYVNRPMAEALELQQPFCSTCYALFRGRKAPCRNCRNAVNNTDGFTMSHNNLALPNLKQQVVIMKSLNLVIDNRNYTIAICKPKENFAKIRENFDFLESKSDLVAVVLDIFTHNLLNPDLQIYGALEMLGMMYSALHVSVYEEARQELVVRRFRYVRSSFWTASPSLDVTDEQDESLPQMIVERAFASKQPAYMLASEVQDRETFLALRKAGIDSIYCAPISCDDRLMGYLFVTNPDQTKLDRYQRLMPLVLNAMAASLWSRRQSILIDSSHNIDTLTNLKNRNALLKDLNSLSGSNNIGVLYVNINGLKTINDTYGMKEGDSILIKIASVLAQLLPEKNNLYRISGDEFLGLYIGTTEKEFTMLSDTLKALLTSEKGFSAAVGSHWCISGKKLQYAVNQAESDMLLEKKRFYRQHPGGARYRLDKDSVLDIISPDKIAQLIENNCFVVVYQPKYSIPRGRFDGAEGLVRLNINGTVIPPGDFIPTLEAAHYTHLVDFFVLESICKTMQDRINQGKIVLPVSCNFSRHTVVRTDFIPNLNRILEQYHIPNNLIILEISERTETIYHKDLQDTTVELADHGYKLSIDDFGVAHANIWALADLPVAEVKFDKKLIDSLLNEDNSKILTILSVMITMCHKLNIKTVAEGVETKMQSEALEKLGCDEIQGYYYSKPVSEEEYYRLIEQTQGGDELS